jgi:hypothetical protein
VEKNHIIVKIRHIESMNAYFLLGGDFNLPDLDWPHYVMITFTYGRKRFAFVY